MPGKYIFPDYRARLAAGLPATWPTIDVQRMPQKKEPGSRPGRDEFRPASTNGSRTGTTCRAPTKDDGKRLQVRAESQQTAIAILHHELPAMPGHVAKSSSEFHALGGVLGIKGVGIFNEQVRVEQ